MSSKIKITILTSLFFALNTYAGEIRIASEVSYPPWNDTDPNGEYIGYEVDLFPLICEKAQLDCVYNAQAFSSIISSVRFKKHDLIMSGLTITPNRRRVINFSHPYGLTPAVFIAKKGSSVTFCQSCKNTLDLDKVADDKSLAVSIIADLGGKKVGVQKNSLTHIYFTEQKQVANKVDLVLTETQDELVDMLEKGKLDVAFSTKSYATDAIKKNNRNIQVLKPNIMGGLLGRGVGIGFRKSDTELKAKVDKAIKELKAEGVLSKLSEKWFGYDMFSGS